MKENVQRGKKPVHILYMITRSDVGGAQRVVADLAKMFGKRTKFEVTLLTGNSGPLTKECRKHKIKVMLERNLRRKIAPLHDLRAIMSLRRTIKKVNPDIIHCHSSKAGLLGRIAAIGLPVKVVFTVHGWVFKRTTSPVKRRLLILVEKLAARITDQIIAVSKNDQELGALHRIRSRRPLILIKNRIADARLRKKPADRARLPLRLVMVARFSEQKDHATLIKAMTLLKNHKKDVALTLVGGGEQFNNIGSMTARMNLNANVTLTGMRSDVPTILKHNDVGLLISNWEGFPVSILEYFRAGLGVIATDVGGVGEMIHGGVNGFLVPQGDADAIAKTIIRLLEAPSLVDKLSAAARMDFDHNYLLKKMISEHEEIYKSLLK